ncbi:MAG: hypothetical protein O8C63_07105 [Candidatus Methanoperedens sp.]|nr:hypothetical protein [Candidatus Methanoperedens sp.]
MVDVSVFNVVHAMDAAENTVLSLTVPEYNLEEKLVLIQKGSRALLNIIDEFLAKGIELERVCRVAVLLCQGGLNKNNLIFQRLADRCALEQKNDGGWLGVVDTMWCASFLELYEEYSESAKAALTWLLEQRHTDGGWGQTERDIGRITVTGQLLYFLPQLASKSSLNWLEDKWRQELEINPRLTYKGAFTLMAFKRNNYIPTDSQLISQTIQWLESEQNDDFGWGPWKEQPTGSNPFCTGAAIVGLSQYHNEINPEVLISGAKWLSDNQLKNGLWAYHYIEDGSSWAFLAYTKAIASLIA